MAVNIFNQESVAAIVEYVERHFDKLEEIISALTNEEIAESYARRKSMVALDATGAGTLEWDVPLGFDWILQRVTTTSTGAGTCSFFVDTMSNSDLVEQIANTQLYADAFQNDIYVPSGSKIFAVFTGGGANGQATVNLQIKLIKRNAHTHTPKSLMVGDA